MAKNVNLIALLAIILFVSGVALVQFIPKGILPFSITAWTNSPQKYPGDAVTITMADRVTDDCSNAVTEFIVSNYELGNVFFIAKSKGQVYKADPMISETTSWVIPSDNKYARTYTAKARVVCGLRTISQGDYGSSDGYSTYQFSIPIKPATVTCTNTCDISGSRDRAYSNCGNYRVCEVQANGCYAWSAEYTQPACVTTPPATGTPTQPPIQSCSSSWQTGEFGECVNGYQNRQVYDANQCNVPTGTMPERQRACEVPPTGTSGTGGTTTDWSAWCKSGGFVRYDATTNACIKDAGPDNTIWYVLIAGASLVVIAFIILLLRGKK